MDSTGTVIVIGGSSGMGLAAARYCLTAGASVVIAGRSPARLHDAAAGLACPDRLRTVVADIGDRAQVAALTEDAMMRAVRSKFLGPFFVAQHAATRMNDGGSITFASGIAAYRPAPGGALAASVNGALEAMVRAFALELAPVRVNAVSPGWVDTPIWVGLATPEAKQARFADLASRLPGRRAGTAEDVARAISYLIEDDFVTGTVLHAEGGQLLV
jgi:NAD(P)-dependent dehydrogenase (short-subunit alcohol dehydrogenase family)